MSLVSYHPSIPSNLASFINPIIPDASVVLIAAYGFSVEKMNDYQIKILTPRDQGRLEQFLSQHVETSMFLLSNLRATGIKDGDAPYQGTYYALFERGSITGVIAHYWNGVIISQAKDRIEQLTETLTRTKKRAIKGILGPASQVERIRSVARIDNSLVQMDEPEILFALELSQLKIPDSLASGEFIGRLMMIEELDLVSEWAKDYAIETLGEADSSELRRSVRLETERYLTEDRTWILEHGGIPVARSAINAALAEIIQIGGVWTPPEFRGRGYGRAVVAATLIAAREKGVKTAILFTGNTNVNARKVYTSLGFKKIGDFRIVLLRGQ